jgi:hypothetical protein
VWLCENNVYQVRTNNIQHLKAHIRDAVAMVTPNMLQATWNKVEYRLDICLATKKADTEICINVYNKCFLRYNYSFLDIFDPDIPYNLFQVQVNIMYLLLLYRVIQNDVKAI